MQSSEIKSNLSQHILPNSSTMIGVCMTVISIIKLIDAHKAQHRIAELLAINSIVFMASALLSYFSMRNESTRRSRLALERLADLVFMFGLIIMTGAGILLAYEIL